MTDYDSQCRAAIARLSRPLLPEPTGAPPRLSAPAGLRAVMFDIYGTLLVSGSGDISLASGAARGDAAVEAMAAVGVPPPAAGEAVVDRLHRTIRQSHADAEADFPEVDIVATWRVTLASFGIEQIAESVAARLATEYECRVNPVWPMPGLVETLARIRDAGLPMGIVSNAQFFTPLAVEQLTGQTLRGLGFLPELCLWSYVHRLAKPGRELYRLAAQRLAERGVASSETLYVGNDMRNDAAPAAAEGFRTALFAGDARSLRLRLGDPMVSRVSPDAVVTRLSQLPTVLSLAGR